MEMSYSFHISSKSNALTSKASVSRASKHNQRLYRDAETRGYNRGRIITLVGSRDILADVENVYHQEFDECISEYNSKQSRDDRKIGDYFKKVSDSSSDVAVEIIVQLGSKEQWENRGNFSPMEDAFKKHLDDIKEQFPNFVIANATCHFDESTPHLHIVGVPIKTDNKRGLSKKVSKTTVFTKETLEKAQHDLRYKLVDEVNELGTFGEITAKAVEKGKPIYLKKEDYVKNKLKSLEKEADSLDYQNDLITRNLINKRNEFNKLTTEIANNSQIAKKQRSELNEINSQILNAKNELKEVNSALTDINKEYDNAWNKYVEVYDGTQQWIDERKEQLSYFYDDVKKVSETFYKLKEIIATFKPIQKLFEYIEEHTSQLDHTEQVIRDIKEIDNAKTFNDYVENIKTDVDVSNSHKSKLELEKEKALKQYEKQFEQPKMKPKKRNRGGFDR